MKKMERKKESLATENFDGAFGRLLNRRVFPWNNQIKTISEAMGVGARISSREIVGQLKQASNMKVDQVISKVTGRAKSWGYSNYLDHTVL